jgi:hypothetical protein
VTLYQTSRHYSEPGDNNDDLASKVKEIESEARRLPEGKRRKLLAMLDGLVSAIRARVDIPTEVRGSQRNDRAGQADDQGLGRGVSPMRFYPSRSISG